MKTPMLMSTVLALGVCLQGCTSEEEAPDLAPELSRETTANQASPSPSDWAPVCEIIYNNPANNQDGVKLCTGTMISNRRFLTAKHCTPETTGAGSWSMLAVRCPNDKSAPAARYSIDSANIKAHGTLDAQVLPLVSAPAAAAVISDVDAPSYWTFDKRNDVSAIGFRNHAPLEFLGTRWDCSSSVCGAGVGLLSMEGPESGDSGGPVFYGGKLAGVLVAIQKIPIYGWRGQYVLISALKDWLPTTIPPATPTPSAPYNPPSPSPSSSPTPCNLDGQGHAVHSCYGSYSCSAGQCCGNGTYKNGVWKANLGSCYCAASGTNIPAGYQCGTSGNNGNTPPPTNPTPSLPTCGSGLYCNLYPTVGTSECVSGSTHWWCCPSGYRISSSGCIAPPACGVGLYCAGAAISGSSACMNGSSVYFCCPSGKKISGSSCI